MADIKLFSIKDGVKELESKTVNLEKELQTIIENNMEQFFGVTFLETEYETTNGGRMDSIGIDENHCPVIFEYKRDVKESVINQGLFYLDWLLDHKDSFKVLVIDKLGIDAAKDIDWSAPRIICVAYDYTKYDESAINQMTRNISLIRYRKFNDDFLMFEKVNENITKIKNNLAVENEKTKVVGKNYSVKTLENHLQDCTSEVKTLFNEVSSYILALGDDVSETRLKRYIAYKRIKNFVCLVLLDSYITLFLKLDSLSFTYEKGFSRNVKDIGHWGTGDVEITIKNKNDFEKAKPFFERAYNEN